MFYDRGEYTGGERSWRYLEAAPADLRLVKGVPTVDSTVVGYSDGTDRFIFGYYRETSDGSNVLLDTKKGVGEGYSNTKMLAVDENEEKRELYTTDSGTSTTSDYAARLCDVLEYEVNGEVFNDWFLPSLDELNLMYQNLYKRGLSSFPYIYYYWSSSESSAYNAWVQHFYSNFHQYILNRGDENRVRPVRAF